MRRLPIFTNSSMLTPATPISIHYERKIVRSNVPAVNYEQKL
jgi:hypothetical protein